MTEKKVLELQIEHLERRRRLLIAEIDLKLKLLQEALSLQRGFEGGRYGFREYDTFDEG